MITFTKRSESPAGNGMVIVHSVPTDHNGTQLDASTPSLLTVQPTINGQPGATNAAPGKLSRAGLLAMVGAANAYLSGLSAANADAISGRLSGGLSVHITDRLVTVPCAPGDAGTLATSLASVLSTAGYVVAL